ncbi:hypothetical protein [Selenomonas sp. AE3005]|uniref:hypothetical protein n=1 Tax=Selenomonas sp. AE3005 TaxID=1485543 RepID=UPI00048591AA|nr:hypothetical protein [Selenomonas sp. AE3005]
MARQQIMGGGYTSLAEEKRNEREAAREKKMRDMFQAAAVASRMNDQTAIGFGLGALLANNWDKWFGGGKGNNSNNNANGNNGQYDFSLSMATAKDPVQMAAAAGDKNAQWVLNHNQPAFSLVDVVQNPASITARPMPDNLTVNGVNPQAPAEMTYQAGIPFTQQTINGQVVTDPNKAMMDSNVNPANFANFAKSVGASTSPFSSAQNYQLADTDWLNKKYPWEVQ